MKSKIYIKCRQSNDLRPIKYNETEINNLHRIYTNQKGQVWIFFNDKQLKLKLN